MEAGSVPFPLVEAKLSRADGTFVSHRSNDYDFVYRNQISRYSLPLLIGAVIYPVPKGYIFLFLNNSQGTEPNIVQNDSDVAYLNMNWQEAVTERFRTNFPSTAGFKAEEILAKTNAWDCTYLLSRYDSFDHQVWALAFVLCETQATSFREQRRPCFKSINSLRVVQEYLKCI